MKSSFNKPLPGSVAESSPNCTWNRDGIGEPAKRSSGSNNLAQEMNNMGAKKQTYCRIALKDIERLTPCSA